MRFTSVFKKQNTAARPDLANYAMFLPGNNKKFIAMTPEVKKAIKSNKKEDLPILDGTLQRVYDKKQRKYKTKHSTTQMLFLDFDCVPDEFENTTHFHLHLQKMFSDKIFGEYVVFNSASGFSKVALNIDFGGLRVTNKLRNSVAKHFLGYLYEFLDNTDSAYTKCKITHAMYEKLRDTPNCIRTINYKDIVVAIQEQKRVERENGVVSPEAKFSYLGEDVCFEKLLADVFCGKETIDIEEKDVGNYGTIAVKDCKNIRRLTKADALKKLNKRSDDYKIMLKYILTRWGIEANGYDLSQKSMLQAINAKGNKMTLSTLNRYLRFIRALGIITMIDKTYIIDVKAQTYVLTNLHLSELKAKLGKKDAPALEAGCTFRQLPKVFCYFKQQGMDLPGIVEACMQINQGKMTRRECECRVKTLWKGFDSFQSRTLRAA